MQHINTLKLLYVEDELTTLLLYEKYFKSKFQNVYTARETLKAFELYEQYKPDVLILDINLPGMSGLDFAKKIREIDSDIKIILLTARNDKDTLMKAIELNLITYLEKPVTRNSLKAAFEKIELSFKNEIDTKRIIYKDEHLEYIWNETKQLLYKNNEFISLTKKETLLLDLFIMKNNEILSYELIHDMVWDDDNKNLNIPAIKTLIKNLRKKLPDEMIKSFYGMGFMLSIK